MLYSLAAHAAANVAWSDFPLALPAEHREDVRFGTITVPMSHDAPTSDASVEFAFMVLPARSRQPASDAVLFLPGGPGAAYSPSLSGFLDSNAVERLRRQRDVVLVDPRGAGLSEPKLCDALDDVRLVYPTIFGEPFADAEARARDAFRACARSLEARGIDPNDWGAAEVADDVELLRRALGYERWTVRGHSYGSRFAQEVLRRHPDTVRAVILSGVWPAGPYTEEQIFEATTGALRTVFDDCAADPVCSQAYPDLATRFVDLIDRLEREPITLRSRRAPVPIVVDGPTLVGVVYQLQYTRASIEIIPLLIDTLAAGDARPLALLTDGLLGYYLATRHDLRHIVQCNDDRYSDDFDPERRFDDPLAQALREIWYPRARMFWGISLHCDVLGIEPPLSRPVRSALPVLVFNGRYDTVTPPGLADRITPYLDNSIAFVVPGRGHDPAAEVIEPIVEFVERPQRRPDLALLDDIAAPEFVADVRPVPGLARLAAGLSSGSIHSAILGWPAVAALLLTAGIGGIPLRALRRRRANAPDEPATVAALAWVAAACGLAFLGLTAAALATTSAANPFLPAFGVGSEWAPVFGLPWLMLAAIAAAGWLCLRLKRRLGRLEVTVATGALVLAGFLLAHGIV